jgi:hypothetical protein
MIINKIINLHTKYLISVQTRQLKSSNYISPIKKWMLSIKITSLLFLVTPYNNNEQYKNITNPSSIAILIQYKFNEAKIKKKTNIIHMYMDTQSNRHQRKENCKRSYQNSGIACIQVFNTNTIIIIEYLFKTI